MKTLRFAALCAMISTVVHAQTVTPAQTATSGTAAPTPSASPAQTPPTQAAPGNNLGQQIATSGAPNGVAPCMSCHGAKGEGSAQGGFPRIAGQSARYLSHQMRSFANGTRENAIMTPIAKAMSTDQMDAVATYYSGLEAPWSKPAAAAGASAARAQTLANVGDESKQVQGCANCHGAAGGGEPPVYPYLAGQHAGYLTAAMAEWKSGVRKNDHSGQMNAIAARLSDADVAALSAYFSQQPAPPPATMRVNVPAGSAQRPVSQTAPAQGSAQPGAPRPGTGTEQGSPTTGGNQGPGGGGSTRSQGNLP